MKTIPKSDKDKVTITVNSSFLAAVFMFIVSTIVFILTLTQHNAAIFFVSLLAFVNSICWLCDTIEFKKNPEEDK